MGLLMLHVMSPMKKKINTKITVGKNSSNYMQNYKLHSPLGTVMCYYSRGPCFIIVGAHLE